MKLNRFSAACSLLLCLGMLAACGNQAAPSSSASTASASSAAVSDSAAPASSQNPEEALSQATEEMDHMMEQLDAFEAVRDEALAGRSLAYNEHLLFEHEGTTIEFSGSATPIAAWEELTSIYPAWGLPQTFEGYAFSSATLAAEDNPAAKTYAQDRSPTPAPGEVFTVDLDIEQITDAVLTYSGQSGTFQLIVSKPGSVMDSVASSASTEPVETLSNGYALATSPRLPASEGPALHWSDNTYEYLLYGLSEETLRSWAEQDIGNELQLIQEA